MPRFLAVYTIRPEEVARFRAMPKSEQDAVDAAGVARWKEWERAHAGSLSDKGGMVGRTLRVSAAGTAPAVNQICGYVVVEADTIEAAAAIFSGHPHFAVFPGDGVDLMPFMTD